MEGANGAFYVPNQFVVVHLVAQRFVWLVFNKITNRSFCDGLTDCPEGPRKIAAPKVEEIACDAYLDG